MDLAVVVPNLNGGRFLGSTLASLAENRDACRWYLQDAKSSDQSATMARSVAGPEDVVVSEKDSGQADGINRAFAECGGEILTWLNSDDEMPPGTAKHVIQCFEANPEVDVVYGAVQWIDESGRATGVHQGRIDTLGDILDLHRCWWGHRQWVQPEVFFRRSLWEKAGPLRTDLHLAFDYALWVSFFLAGARTYRTDQVLARFRIHQAQKSNDSELASRELRSVARGHLDNPSLALRGPRRHLIERRLEYDEWARGELPNGHPLAEETQFVRALTRRPGWLLDPWVRRRILSRFTD